MNKENLKANDYVQDFNEDAWLDFHQGTINNQDDFYEYFNSWIDNKVIYYSEARDIFENLDANVFAEHDLFGRANDWTQAGHNALYDCLMDNDDTVTWSDMEDYENEDKIETTIAGVDFSDSLDALKKITLKKL